LCFVNLIKTGKYPALALASLQKNRWEKGKVRWKDRGPKSEVRSFENERLRDCRTKVAT